MPAWRDSVQQLAAAIGGGGAIPDPLAFDPYDAAAIYRNNYRSNLHEALSAAYPVIVQLVGADFFKQLTRQYISQYPSTSGNLHHYGAQMPGFLATFVPAQSLPYLGDVAGLEWACHLAYYAVDVAPLDLNRLQTLDETQYADLVWRCHPACQLRHSPYPLHAIWQAHQADADPDFHIDIDSGGGTVLVSRSQGWVTVAPLPLASAQWLQHVQAGATLAVATAATMAEHPAFDLNAVMSGFVVQGALVDFSLACTS